jgi:hypothetical protein
LLDLTYDFLPPKATTVVSSEALPQSSDQPNRRHFERSVKSLFSAFAYLRLSLSAILECGGLTPLSSNPRTSNL